MLSCSANEFGLAIGNRQLARSARKNFDGERERERERGAEGREREKRKIKGREKRETGNAVVVPSD